MDNTLRSSRRRLLIGIGAALGLITVLGIAAFILFGNQRNTDSQSTSSTGQQVATKAEVQQSIEETTTAIKQSARDQTATRAAAEDKDRVELSSE